MAYDGPVLVEYFSKSSEVKLFEFGHLLRQEQLPIEFICINGKYMKQGGNSLKDLRRMSFQGQGHFKVKDILRSRSFQG